jgi:hypothetical protein
MHSTSKVPGLGADWNAMRVRVSGGYMLQGVQWPWQSLAVVPLGIGGPVAWIGCYEGSCVWGLHVAGSAVALAVIGCCSPRTRWPGLE